MASGLHRNPFPVDIERSKGRYPTLGLLVDIGSRTLKQQFDLCAPVPAPRFWDSRAPISFQKGDSVLRHHSRQAAAIRRHDMFSGFRRVDIVQVRDLHVGGELA